MMVKVEEDDCEDTGKYQCSKCQRVFDSETKMRRHIFIQHDPGEMECFHCFAKYDSMLHFERHIATHFCRNEYLCDFCPTMFNRVSGLLDHLAKHKNERQRFTCPECGKILANRLSFTTHQRTHTGEKPHACRFCDRTFSQVSSCIKLMPGLFDLLSNRVFSTQSNILLIDCSDYC